MRVKDYPREIHFRDLVYNLRFVSKKEMKKVAGGECLGLYDQAVETIYLLRGQTPRDTLETCVHELLHLLEIEGEIPALTHPVINKLEVAITDLLIDNGWVRWRG